MIFLKKIVRINIIIINGHQWTWNVPQIVDDWLFHYSIPQNFVPAINALAWYYEKFNQDYKQAVKLWEQADELGSPDAALNLAVMHSQGLYPGKAANQVSSSMLFVIV